MIRPSARERPTNPPESVAHTTWCAVAPQLPWASRLERDAVHARHGPETDLEVVSTVGPESPDGEETAGLFDLPDAVFPAHPTSTSSAAPTATIRRFIPAHPV
ncbi:hypothetical protein OG806_43145 [Streptomyces sp. NBC_00882]|nr:hypothetical protein OG806_43145 [Streptomyces sp. NBC_00882]WSZ62666.1 hypothetical protein OH824_42060 [Streptomyces canus]